MKDNMVSFEILKDTFHLNSKFELVDVNEYSSQYKLTPLAFCVTVEDLTITEQQWDFLIKNSNFNLLMDGDIPLIIFIHKAFNKHFKMKMEYWDIILQQIPGNTLDPFSAMQAMYSISVLASNKETIESYLYKIIDKTNLRLLGKDNHNLLSLIVYYFDAQHYSFLLDIQSHEVWEKLFSQSILDKVITHTNQTYTIESLIRGISSEAWREYLLKHYHHYSYDSSSKIAYYQNKLDQVIGINEVKDSFRNLIKLKHFNSKHGLPITTHTRMIFVGNQGTGKSLISTYIAELYHLLNITKRNECKTIFNDGLFNASYGGADNTIYCKFDTSIKYDGNVEIQMIDFIKRLSNSSLFILSITPKELEDIKVKYPKFYSLFTKTIQFPDYSSTELAHITRNMASNQGFQFSDESLNALTHFYDYSKKDPTITFSNVHLAKATFTKILELHAVNTDNDNKVFAINDIPVIAQESKNVPISELLNEINELTGLDSVKSALLDYIALVQANKRRGTTMTTNMHMVFSGNPGTGKTTVARLVGKIYQSLGLLTSGHVVEVDRGHLVGQYIGHTAIQTKNIIAKSMGGILFIDEAYSLANGSTNDFGKEAIDTLLKIMEDQRKDFAVIVAGYTEEMNTFISSNPGLKSRFTKKITFSDYSTDELITIFKNICLKENFTYDDDFLEQAKIYLEKLKSIKKQGIGFSGTNTQNDKNFGNAREVRTLFEKVLEKQALRIMNDDLSDPWVLSSKDILSITN